MFKRRRGVIVGYWRELGAEDPETVYPDPHDLVDVSWSHAERQLVAQYLAQGELAASYRGYSTCRICGCSNGSAELTDGQYRWPAGLGHYVLEHAVRFNDAVIAKALAG